MSAYVFICTNVCMSVMYVKAKAANQNSVATAVPSWYSKSLKINKATLYYT